MSGATQTIQPGTLRDDVDVVFLDDTVRITYSLWEVSLPAAWINTRPDVEAFLQRHAKQDEVGRDAEAASVIALLDAQGCIVPEAWTGSISLATLRARFDRLRSAWYAIYYAHPLWDHLRSGKASRNELAAYLVHNYHVSRAAGPVAARMAHRGPRRWRDFFNIDALGEFWHCESYYLVQSKALGCTPEDIKHYVPLPSSTAFEQHALQLAENDGIAHLLIAYFQESSIVFHRDAIDFYQEVERAYDLEGFFRPWQAHIGIDLAEEHAAGLAGLFETDVMIPAKEGANAIVRAWVAFHFLCAALNDVVSEARDDGCVLLRYPLEAGGKWSRTRVSSLGHDASVAVIVASILDPSGFEVLGTLAQHDVGTVRAALHASAVAALGAARRHEEVMLAGRMASAFGAAQASTDPANPWTLAVTCFLLEAAVRPVEWAAVVALLAQLLDKVGEDFEVAQGELSRRLASIPGASVPGIATELARFREILARWAVADQAVPQDLCPVTS